MKLYPSPEGKKTKKKKRKRKTDEEMTTTLKNLIYYQAKYFLLSYFSKCKEKPKQVQLNSLHALCVLRK